MQDLVCISHLRWDFVWQRPQHLLSRMAQRQRVFFIEEPVASVEAKIPYLQRQMWQGENDAEVVVVRLVQPVEQARWIGHGDPLTAATYQRLLREYMQEQHVRHPILWLYTPMAQHFINALRPKLLVYDVMDQLSAFKGAPADIVERDREVLERADVVFTGGISLYQDKRDYSYNIYPFPSGVEADHFAQATDSQALARPEDIVHIQSPIVGYYGVIDERMDLKLIQQIADERPEWNLVLIGPVVKIDPQELPQAANIHYVGMKTYEQLPAYLAHFDVALIPFAMNEATRYLSPTKTLEYLAAGKPVVSTPIHDVIELYGSVVNIGYTTAEFIQHIADALTQPVTAEQRQAETLLLQEYAWDAIAERMQRLIQRKYHSIHPGAVAVQPPARAAIQTP
ncbi:MAG: glycosyltransferase [Chloroflexota bacterium]|nr:glycosyltransferase [Chloroflexota bacterium]